MYPHLFYALRIHKTFTFCNGTHLKKSDCTIHKTIQTYIVKRKLGKKDKKTSGLHYRRS